MDAESGESTVENEVAGVERDESELEWLVRGCRRDAAGADSRDEVSQICAAKTVPDIKCKCHCKN